MQTIYRKRFPNYKEKDHKMEKTNLDRGLEEISNIFLSTTKKPETRKSDNAFSAVTIREETCASCANMIEGSFREPKCRIFTFENEKYGLPQFDTIALTYANYCEYFEPETAKIAGKTKNKTPDLLEEAEVACEIEEKISVQKKIAFPDTEAAQIEMKDSLAKYLETGYRIKSIELEKTGETATPKGKEIRKEEIMISVKK